MRVQRDALLVSAKKAAAVGGGNTGGNSLSGQQSLPHPADVGGSISNVGGSGSSLLHPGRLDEAEFELPSELDDQCVICMDGPCEVGFSHGASFHVCVCRACTEELKERQWRKVGGAGRNGASSAAAADVLPVGLLCPQCQQAVEHVVPLY